MNPEWTYLALAMSGASLLLSLVAIGMAYIAPKQQESEPVRVSEALSAPEGPKPRRKTMMWLN